MLEEDLAKALAGSGRAVIVHGSEGCGRTAFVQHFAAEARRRHHRLRSAIGDAADPQHPAWAQLAFSFTAGRRAGGVMRRSIRDWIGVTPVVGPILAAAAETLRQLRPAPASAPQPMLGTGSSIDQVRLLLSYGAGDPRLIILENLDASDRAELAGAFALIQRLGETRTLFIATCRSVNGRMPPAAADLGSEIERLRCGRIIELTARAPSNRELSDDEIRAFSPRERTLLTAAAQIGARFDANTLAAMLGWDDARLDDALAPLVRRRLLLLVETRVLDDEIIDCYAFRSPSDATRWALVQQKDPDSIAVPPDIV